MKKTNLLKGALSVLAVSVLLASCTQVDSRIDTIDTLETPSVKAVAYPGVNYISWDAVKGAQGYKVTKIVDGGFEEVIESDCNTNFITNVVPTDKVDVEYKVYALSNTDPSRAVYIYDSKAGSATVTNIFPPVGTEAIELPKYEKDSGWDFDEDADNSEWKDEFIPTKDNIKVNKVDENYVITVPTKAYLTTKIAAILGNKEDIYDYDNDNNHDLTSVNQFGYQNKYNTTKAITFTSAGEYKIKATVNFLGEDKADCYYKRTVIDLDPIVIGAVETSTSSEISVSYINTAKTIARVKIIPAVAKDGKQFAVENYKVYRALKGSKQLDEVTGLKADSETGSNGVKTVYYVVDDTVPANNVDYDYYALLSVNGCLEAGEKTDTLYAASPVKVDAIETLNVNAVALDEDGITNDIIVTVKPATGTKIVAISYGVVDSASNVLDSAYANTIPVVTKLADQKQTYLIGKNIEPGKVVVVKAEAAEIEPTGKDNVVKTAKIKVGKVQSADAATITVATPSQKNGDKDLLNNDWLNNKINLAKDTSIVSVKYAFADTVELAKVAAVNGKDITMKVLDYTLGNNDDYIFDIEDAGTVGQYLGIAVEVKAEGKTNTIAVAANNNKVSVNYADASISCSSTMADSESKKSTLSLDLSLFVNKDTNKTENYAGFEVSWIEAKNSTYEIDPAAEWTTKTYTTSDLSKFNDENYTVNVEIFTQPVDLAKVTENKTKYFVAKVVTKYTVNGAVEQISNPVRKVFTYPINK